jgi:predicted metal-binding protein
MRSRLHDHGRHRPAPAVEVLVCRGCCCGSAAEHPDVDHDGHLDRLRRAAAASPVPTRLRTVGCLSACALSNVVVVRRHHGAADWFALVLEDDVVEALARWVAAGAAHPVPEPVRRYTMPVPDGRPVG